MWFLGQALIRHAIFKNIIEGWEQNSAGECLPSMQEALVSSRKRRKGNLIDRKEGMR